MDLTTPLPPLTGRQRAIVAALTLVCAASRLLALAQRGHPLPQGIDAGTFLRVGRATLVAFGLPGAPAQCTGHRKCDEQ